MVDPLSLQRQRNRETRNSAESFAPHTETIMGLISASRRYATDRLCILGAGNCNDIHLPVLAEQFQEVHLVDVDADALDGVEGASDGRATNVHRHPLDLTGWYEQASIGTTEEKSAAIANAAASFRPTIAGQPFDVVASTCLLSQINDSVVATLGREHAELNARILAVRKQHLVTMLDQLPSGGRGLLITDFVSSDTLPSLLHIENHQIKATAASAIAAGNFFTGLNPGAILNSLESDEDFRLLTKNVQVSSPWKWKMGPRVYAVAAIAFQRVGP